MQASDIEQLVFDLYHNPENQIRANQILTLAQVSPEAWSFSWTFLSSVKPVEVQYFGASSLHLKISKCWHELGDNENAKIDLRNRLMEQLVYLMTSGTRIVQTRMTVALASFVVHTVTNIWQTAIPDLIQNISIEKLGSQVSTPKIIHTLLELLMTIPEEFHSIYMTHSEKGLTRTALLKFVDDVYNYLENILAQDSSADASGALTEIQQTAIKCYSNWTQHLGTLVLTPLQERILDLCLNKLSNEDLVSYVVEAIIAIYTHPESHNFHNSILKLIQKLVAVIPILDLAIAEDRVDHCITLYSVYVQIAETHSRLLLDIVSGKPEERENISRLISVIIRCAGTPGYYPVDETCSEQSFNFFYILQDDIIGSEQEKIQDYLILFKPLYETLIETLLRKVQYPDDFAYENEWNSEDKEAFRCYRQDIGDTFMYCYNMLRSTVMSLLRLNFERALTNLCSYVNTVSVVNPKERPWQPLEAVLFALCSVAENVSSNEDSSLDFVFEALTSIPFSASERLLATSMDMVGSYCEWIFHHQIVLPRVLTLLLLGLTAQNPITTVSATMALKDLTRECQILMAPYSSSILMACIEGLKDDSHLKPKEKVRLMCSAGQVLSLLSHNEIQSYLSQILPPIITKLQQCLQETDHDRYFIAKNEVKHQLNMMGMLFSSLDLDVKKVSADSDMNEELEDPVPSSNNNNNNNEERLIHPLFHVFQQLMPLFAEVSAKWLSEEAVIESLSDCIKKAVLALLDDVKVIVDQVIQLITRMYISTSQPSLIDVIKQLIMLFSCDEEIKPQLVVCFSQFCFHTVSVCCNLRDRTNLIEYFYVSASSLLKKQAELFACPSVDSHALFRLAIASMILPERPTVKSVVSFLTEFINKSPDYEKMKEIVKNEGQDVVTQIFIVISGIQGSPRNVVEFMADILVALNQKYFDNLNAWLMKETEKNAFPSERVTKEQKENFMRLVLRERRNKRKVRDLVSEFTLICRGLVSTPYGMPSTKILPL